MPPDAILLIDDEAIIRQGIKTLLEEEGHVVHLASTASEGIKELKDAHFDLILLDYMLPDMDGIEAFKKIKEISQATPVILITGYGTKELAIEALKLDVFDFIEKPLHPQILRRAIHHCLEVQRLQQEREHERKERTKFLTLLPTLATSHRFNNYLAVVSGNLQLLEKSCPAPGKHEFTAPMKKALQECQGLMNQIRHASKIEKELKLLDINQLIQEVISELRPQWMRPDTKYTITFDPVELPRVRTNALDMKDIFANLIINALEAMPQGGEITLKTGVEKDTTEVWSLIISVKDTGPDIPEEMKDRLFEPFFTTKEYGQGLGLFLTRHILFQYGGKIKVESKPGQGACFTIWLPIARKAAATE